MKRALWFALMAVALAWPARAISWTDGVPFDRPLEAGLVGLLIPSLGWLAPAFVDKIGVRLLVAALLALKLGGSVALAQEGWCGQFHLAAPLAGSIPKPSLGAAQSIPVDEPYGILRSWDLRADWRRPRAECSAIVTRSYLTQAEYPAWFLNLLGHVDPPRADLAMHLSGFVTVDESGTLRIKTGDALVSGRIGSVEAPPQRGDADFVLQPGVHRVDLSMPLSSEPWHFVATWNDRDLWTTALTSVSQPSALDRFWWRAGGLATVALVIGLAASWLAFAWRALSPGAAVAAWTGGAAALLAALSMSPRGARLASLPLLAAPFVPVPRFLRNVRGAFLLVGVAWLMFFAVRSAPQIGRITLYSGGDDWLTYQVAGYRIFMGGYWLEGGNALFNYQPLYRWTTGVLHMLFGDSSIGEVYWDAACLLTGAMLSYRLVEPIAGFRAGVAAAGLTLTVFTLTPIWYFIGRGLSEIAAAGWGFVAALLLLRARNGRALVAVAAGVFATLMFYTRLNHVIFMFALAALLIPSAVPSRAAAMLEHFTRLATTRAAAAYVLALFAGLALFALRTWHYIGVFSIFAGTSLAINDTGLRLTTLGSPDVWRRVGHSVMSLVWANDPPRPDLRALPLFAGAACAVLAICQVPRFRELSLGLVVVLLGGAAGALFAHTHNYPGRMSIHLVPIAVALVLTTVWPRQATESA